ncbi:MAG TPA: chemotaxis protein CheC [Geobacteraceae bacterium]
MGFSQMSAQQMEALQEVSLNGMDHAVCALSEFVKMSISPGGHRILGLDDAEVRTFLKEAHLAAIGINLRITGDAEGDILIVFTRQNAAQIVDSLLSRDSSAGAVFSEMEISCLKEVGNILASAYLNALGERLKMTLVPSVPELAMDMSGGATDIFPAKPGNSGDPSLMFETEFSGDGGNFTGHFFLLADSGSLAAMLRNIGP